MCLGIPGRIVAIEAADGLAMGTVDFGGVRKQVCLAYAPDARIGDYVIVHVGFAISRVDAAEAQRTLAVLRAMGDAVATELGEPLP
ncbi:HypC/HybG/HupF family hydrogenase formation chaperone [Actinoplanes sp. NPDC049265]|uniref:HypC/HybG/HupF family hydrogenase formation chaperone n=1 Tax=Actinoplanes sp. NPDC049265 TaxID=3363902 RepID=UPI00372347FD